MHQLTKRRMKVFYREAAFFLLDSTPASSLTLRDYSKVVAGSNRRMRQKPPPMRTVGGAMPSLRFRCSAVCLTVLLSFIPSTLFPQGTPAPLPRPVAHSSAARLATRKAH